MVAPRGGRRVAEVERAMKIDETSHAHRLDQILCAIKTVSCLSCFPYVCPEPALVQ